MTVPYSVIQLNICLCSLQASCPFFLGGLVAGQEISNGPISRLSQAWSFVEVGVRVENIEWRATAKTLGTLLAE